MSDIEASELLRKLLTDLTTAEKELEESDFLLLYRLEWKR